MKNFLNISPKKMVALILSTIIFISVLFLQNSMSFNIIMGCFYILSLGIIFKNNNLKSFVWGISATAFSLICISLTSYFIGQTSQLQSVRFFSIGLFVYFISLSVSYSFQNIKYKSRFVISTISVVICILGVFLFELLFKNLSYFVYILAILLAFIVGIILFVVINREKESYEINSEKENKISK